MHIERTIRHTALATVTFLAIPVAAFAQCNSTGTFCDIIYSDILPLLDLLVIFIIALTVLFVMWNGAQMIMHADNVQKRADSRSMMLWGIVVLFIMISMWGIIEILKATFGI